MLNALCPAELHTVHHSNIAMKTYLLEGFEDIADVISWRIVLVRL
jgi:hypothetical protein